MNIQIGRTEVEINISDGETLVLAIQKGIMPSRTVGDDSAIQAYLKQRNTESKHCVAKQDLASYLRNHDGSLKDRP